MLVDDDAELCSLLGEFLTREGFTVECAHEGARGLERALSPGVDLVLLDVSMPDGGGWAAARGLREVCPGIRLVAFTSFDNALVIRTIAAAGINAYVTKGSAIEVLLAAIHGEDVMPAPPQRMSLIRRTAGVTTD